MGLCGEDVGAAISMELSCAQASSLQLHYNEALESLGQFFFLGFHFCICKMTEIGQDDQVYSAGDRFKVTCSLLIKGEEVSNSVTVHYVPSHSGHGQSCANPSISTFWD